MAFSGGDLTWVIYQGPPRWDGEEWIDGDRFFLSGHRQYQLDKGVELARSLTGMERDLIEHRYDTGANNPRSRYVSSVSGRREIQASVNILGDTPAELRANKRRWYRNHPEGNPGRLWVFTSDGAPRYLSVIASESAAQGSLNQDPAMLRKYADLDWGWTSDFPYFLGYRETKELEPKGGGVWAKTFFNISTVPQIYPVLYLPGAGTWEVSLGYQQGTFDVVVGTGEEVRLEYNPIEPTLIKRNIATGAKTNMWPTMVGKRPKYSLEAETKNTFSVRLKSGNPASHPRPPRLVFTPQFISWI